MKNMRRVTNLIVPLGCWHILNEEENALKIFFLLQIWLPSAEKGSAHVEVELVEAVWLREVSVPQPDGGVQWQLPQQQVVHPPEDLSVECLTTQIQRQT